MTHTQWSEHLRNVAQTISYIIGAIAAILAAVAYRKNARLERSRWLTQLYEKFYERDGLKHVRDSLDQEPADHPAVLKLVREEQSSFTDYLNFFEYVVYLKSQKQLTEDDVNAMFQYYLAVLARHKSVRDYIQNHAKGYQHLNNWLVENLNG